MRVMDELSESTHRWTPSFPHAGSQSPRVGGCVGKFYQLFDWNLTKRFPSTKRIVSDRPNQDAFYARRDVRFTERATTTNSKLPLREREDAVSPLTKTPILLHSTSSPASVKSDDTSKRVPGVVARLMGLESLPGRTYVSSPKSGTSLALPTIPTESPPREQLGHPPVLLQELLRQEFKQSKKSLKDKFPAFTKLGAVTQKTSPSAHSEEHVQRYGNSRAQRPVSRSEKIAVSFTPEEGKTITKLQPFLARLHTGAPPHQPSSSQTFSSPVLSPSMIRGKDTVRLLEAAVKTLEPIMQPSPRRKYSLNIRDPHRDAQSESSGVSSRSERRALTGSRGGGLASSSSRSFRSPSTSRTWSVKDDRALRSGHDSISPGSRSSRARHEPGRQVQASRTRREMNSVTSSRSVSPLQSHRSRASTTKRVEDSPRVTLGTHEASIRGFKTDLRNQIDSPSEKKLEVVAQDHHPQSVEVEVGPERPPLTPSPDHANTSAKVDSPEPCNLDQNAEVLQADISQTSPSVSKTVPEKSSSGGFRAIRFRNRSGKQEKDVGGQGNRVFPSDKSPVEKPVGLPSTQEAKAAGAAFSYTLLFSRKQGDKKEGNDKVEAVVVKRTDSTFVRSLLKRTSKYSKRVNVEVEKKEFEESLGNQESSSQEPALSPTHKQLEKTKGPSFVQARYRSIDDVFPELPMEEKDGCGASPDLGKTIRAVEEKFLGFGAQGDVDCQSIERMFGKGFSRTLYAETTAPEKSSKIPEEFRTEPGEVPGTFPNSPSTKDEGSCFSSRNQLNLQEMFEVVSGERSQDSTGRRRSFSLSEPRERVLHDEEVGAESDTCSTSAGIAERVENERFTAAAECSEDAMTPPALKEFEEKLVHAGWSEDAMTPPALKKFEEKLVHAGWSEDAMTPPALKKFEEKLAQGFSDSDDSHVPCGDECGQPSPVSVLQCPFLEEAPRTPDASSAELQQTDEPLNDIDIDITEPSVLTEDEEQTQEAEENTATSNILEVALPETIETDMIEQAILQISAIRNIDVRTIGIEAPAIAPPSPQQEQDYIREVLDAANLLSGELRHSHSPFNRSLFDRLESGTGILRSDRKLLFDSVNEVMVLEPWLRTSPFYVDLPMFPDLHLNSKFRQPISGEPLVMEVHRMFSHWRDIAGNELDDLIDYDMNVPEGRWLNFSYEVSDIALLIERALLKGMITDVVDDLTSISETRALR
ncbi:hypothetical protein M758_12G119000 [Ceratodon purpureus]|nr:hypothetical protein M758_12G119000 [Ceratodon purpureus]